MKDRKKVPTFEFAKQAQEIVPFRPILRKEYSYVSEELKEKELE